jgi:hypothetical protein
LSDVHEVSSDSYLAIPVSQKSAQLPKLKEITADNDGAYHITSDATSAAQFARPPSETKGFNLAVMGQDEFFGAIGGRRDASSRSPLFAGLSRVANHNGQPIKERDENKETETQIWSINPNTLELTATWQSVDGLSYSRLTEPSR